MQRSTTHWQVHKLLRKNERINSMLDALRASKTPGPNSRTQGLCVVVLIGFFSVASAQRLDAAQRLLPPAILADRYLIQAEQLHAERDYAGAYKVMEKIIVLQEKHDLKLPDEFHYRYARVALSADSIRVARDSINRYLTITGRSGEYYTEALALSIEAEGPEIGTGETCTGKPVGAGCWMALVQQPECYYWNPSLKKDQSATWTGKCSGGAAHGKGQLTWTYTVRDSLDFTETGSGHVRKGKLHGRWVFQDQNGYVDEGAYVDGNRHGEWVAHRGYDKYRSSCVHGTLQYAEMTVRDEGKKSEGPYSNGKRHGKRVTVHRNRYRTAGEYVDGEKDGIWLEYVRTSNDKDECWSRTYRNGEKVNEKKVKTKTCRK